MHSLSIVVLVFFIASLVAPAAATARKVADPFDLAAVMLTPDDLANVGLDGFSLEWSFQAHAPDLIADWSALTPLDDATNDVDAFRAAAPDRGFINHLIGTSSLDPDMSGYVGYIVISFTFEYASSREAGAGFDAMTDIWLESETTAEQQIPITLAKDQMLVVGIGSNPWGPEEIDRGSIAFRDGNLIGGIILLNYENDDHPAGKRIMPHIPDAIVDLAQTQMDRMDDVVLSGGPGLSTTILRLDVAPEDVLIDFYPTIAAVVLCPSLAFQLKYEDCDFWQAIVTARGELSRYSVRYALGTEIDPSVPSSLIHLIALTFADAETAESHVAGYPKSRKATEGSPADFTVSNVDLGDEAYTLSWTRANSTWSYLELQVRVDSTVLRFEFQTRNEDYPAQTPEVSEVMFDLMELQLACFEGEMSCIDPFPVPEGFSTSNRKESGLQQQGASLRPVREEA